MLITILMYVFYLLPYILISYYDRYVAPLFFVKVLLVVFAVDTVFNCFRQRLVGQRHYCIKSGAVQLGRNESMKADQLHPSGLETI